MDDLNKDAFLDAKNALLLVKILSRLDNERQSNKWLDDVLAEVESANGYNSPVPLVNQATFLAMAYATLVSLRESYFKDAAARRVLAHRVKGIFDDPTLEIEIGPKAQKIKDNGAKLVQRVRNSLGHSSVEIADDSFLFSDSNPGEADDWAKIKMSWPTLGQLCVSVVMAGNDLLYPTGAE